MDVGRVDVAKLINIMRETDPRTAVGKELTKLHKDIQEIMERTDKDLADKKVRLEQISRKIGEAVRMLKSGGDKEQVADLLQNIKNDVDDPEVQTKIYQVRKLADDLRKNQVKMANLDNSATLV